MEQVRVKSGATPYLQEIESAGHDWKADEVEELGGGNQGPTPHQLLLGALGACTAITVQMYAKHKEWPLESLEVTLEHERIQAADCPDCDAQEGMVSQIRLRLALTGPLDEGQRQRLLEVSGKCPVKKTLSGEVKIRSQLET